MSPRMSCVLLSLLFVLPSCRDAGAPATTPSVPVIAWQPCPGTCIVEMTLTTRERTASEAPPRVASTRWFETLTQGPRGLALTIAPSVAREGSAGKMESRPCPAGIDYSPAPGLPPERSLLVGVRFADRAATGSDSALWSAWIHPFLFFRELAYALLPGPGDTPAPEWDIDLDAAAFARRTRLKAWAEKGLSVRGSVAYKPRSAWAAPDSPSLRGVVCVERRSGERLALQIDVDFSAARHDIDAVRAQGVLRPAGGAANADTELEFDEKRVE